MIKETENRYSGIPTIQKEMMKANLPKPEFSVRNGEFKVILRNNLPIVYYEEFIDGQEMNRKSDRIFHRVGERDNALLEYCKIPRSREEIIGFVGFSRYYTMNKIMMPLIEKGYINMTLPDKPKSSKQKYYAAEIAKNRE